MQKIKWVQVLILLLCLSADLVVIAQNATNDVGRFSGDLQFNAKLYVTDTLLGANIGANSTPFYDYLKSSSDAWLRLNYNKGDFGMGIRFDMYNNSDIFTGGLTEVNGLGIGNWYIRQKIQKLTIQGGYIYDQFGSGTTFRAYENRPLAIDNALVGLMGKYELTNDLTVKVIAGKQKNLPAFVNPDRRFVNVYEPFIKGASLEGFFSFNKEAKEEGGKGLNMSFVPGISFVNRTLDIASVELLAGQINKQDEPFYPLFNTNAFSIYNTLNIGNVNVYLEYAGKSDDTMTDPFKPVNRFFRDKGRVLFGSVSYSQKGFGVTVQAKRTKNFEFRTTPLQTMNQGLINFLAPQTRQNSLRLLARYNSNTQLLDEMSHQVDLTYSPSKKVTFHFNWSDVRNTDDGTPVYDFFGDEKILFRELYLDAKIKLPNRNKLLVGIQMVDYNQRVFETKPAGTDNVNTFTPFAEFTWKIDRKKSIRVETQYMLTKRNYVLFGKDDPYPDKEQDLGDWLYGLVEYNVAPKYSISVSDMYNVPSKVHYYDFSASYTNKTNRFALGFVRQVQGIICTGGVCRFENAFSGVKFNLTSSF